MNNSTSSGRGFLGGDIISFGYGISVSIGILLLITTITLASYFCKRNQQPPPPIRFLRINQVPRRDDSAHDQSVEVAVVGGLDEETVESYPKLLYSEAKLKKSPDSTTASCCSICLVDYKSSDVLRALPECNHLFHVKCVDPWLRLHPTCPVCRTSPLPTPFSTPLAEVVSFASHGDRD